ncbi:hypothetical protein E2C01_102573 [Portunus trituberculatus]|uniref:Uncharacterized protein n=1 Tax=Portunus trituberculatus TaxID=210409 RepID=A0A5B7KIV1_PORTR|nr:hypothetical protein [Portunus trituberculatus]
MHLSHLLPYLHFIKTTSLLHHVQNTQPVTQPHKQTKNHSVHSPFRPPPSAATTCRRYRGALSLSKQQRAVVSTPVASSTAKSAWPELSSITFFSMKYLTFAFLVLGSSRSVAKTWATCKPGESQREGRKRLN